MSIEINSKISDIGESYDIEIEAKKGLITKKIGYRFKKPIPMERLELIKSEAESRFRFLDENGISLDKYWEYGKYY